MTHFSNRLKILSYRPSLASALAISMALAGVTMTTAYADDALKMTLEANQVLKQADGTVKYSPISTAKAGTVVQYEATYSNTIDQPISDVSVTLPIPQNMAFTGEAYPASAQGSTDGTNFADMPLMKRVDGKLVKVPYADYTALRWNIKYLPAKKSASVTLNAVVE